MEVEICLAGRREGEESGGGASAGVFEGFESPWDGD